MFRFAALWLLKCHDYPRAAFDVNIRGTFNVMEACVANGIKDWFHRLQLQYMETQYVNQWMKITLLTIKTFMVLRKLLERLC